VNAGNPDALVLSHEARWYAEMLGRRARRKARVKQFSAGQRKKHCPGRLPGLVVRAFRASLRGCGFRLAGDARSVPVSFRSGR